MAIQLIVKPDPSAPDQGGSWQSAVAAGVAVAVVSLVVLVAWRTRRGFEAVTPPLTTEPKEAGLSNGQFFGRSSLHLRWLWIHICVLVATLAWVFWTARGEKSLLPSAADAIVYLGAAQFGLLIVFGFMTVRWAGWWSLGAVGAAGLGIGLIGGLMAAAIRFWLVPSCEMAAAGEVPSCSAYPVELQRVFAMFDIYGLAALVGLGVLTAITTHALLTPAPNEDEAVRLKLLPTPMSRLRARAAIIPSQIIGAASAAVLTFIVGAIVVFPRRMPDDAASLCRQLPSFIRDRPTCSNLPSQQVWVLTETPLVRVAQFTLFAVLGFVVLNGIRSWGSSESLRRVGSIWDVLTFWPRRFHPLAVRPYAERAVPELTTILAGRTAVEPTKVLAHSQGSILVFAAIAPLPSPPLPPVTGGKKWVLSFGSPLVALYHQAFPAYFGVDCITAVATETVWSNVFRFTDHVGRDLFSTGAWEAGGRDRALADPAAPGQSVSGHNDYWIDPRLEVEP